MNETIIKNFNSVVSENDLTYVLGDLCLGGGGREVLEKNKQLIERLNGKIYVIRGNHDSDSRLDMYLTCSNILAWYDATSFTYKKYHFFLSHFPALVSNWGENDKPLKQRTINLCGHSHTQDRWTDWDKSPIYHCELDAHNNYPILLDDALQEMREKYRLDETVK